MECWDAYNRQGQKLPIVLNRGDKIPQGVYHIVVETLVQHCDGEYLLMQRDWNKKGHPGLFEASGGGSALQGETAEICAIREIKEETGLDIIELNLIQKDFHFRDGCYWHTFHGIVDQPKDSVILQKGETISYRWVSQEELLDFIHSDEAIPESVQRFNRFYRGLLSR